MGFGGLIAGLSVALLSGWISRTTALREDASFASFYLTSLALGVLIVCRCGSNIDLFTYYSALSSPSTTKALYLVGGIASLALFCWRWSIGRSSRSASIRASFVPSADMAQLPLVPVPCRAQPRRRLPGAGHVDGRRVDDAARSSRSVVGAKPAGDVPHRHSHHFRLSGAGGVVPFRMTSGPAIILTASIIYGMSLLFSPTGALRRLFPRPHYGA